MPNERAQLRKCPPFLYPGYPMSIRDHRTHACSRSRSHPSVQHSVRTHTRTVVPSLRNTTPPRAWMPNCRVASGSEIAMRSDAVIPIRCFEPIMYTHTHGTNLAVNRCFASLFVVSHHVSCEEDVKVACSATVAMQLFAASAESSKHSMRRMVSWVENVG